MSTDVYAAVTDSIIAAIEAGAGKWRMPWHSGGAGLERPINAQTGNAYRGVNVLALWVSAANRGYATGTWATYKQWKARGAQVQRGQKGTVVAFYKQWDAETTKADGTTEKQKRFMARASFVFNADQVDGWTPPEAPTVTSPVAPVQAADAFVQGTGASVRHGGSSAHYSPAGDHIQMPPREAFTGTDTSSATESYYSTLLHELVHWTGPKDRCNREFGQRFGDRAYAMEELVAELGAAFLCADLGISLEPRADHAKYLNAWLQVLKADKRAIFTASSKAATATDWLHKLQK